MVTRPIPSPVEQLQDLARTDPTVAPLALLHAVVLSAAEDRAWEDAVPSFDQHRLRDGLPLLHGQTLTVDASRAGQLLSRLATTAAQSGIAGAAPLREAVAKGTLDPLALLEASIEQNVGKLALLAETLDLEIIVTLANLASMPLLQACGRKAAAVLEGQRWETGYCPVCTAWPTLAELRGIERWRWLRCGRCATGWRFPAQRCTFCGNADHKQLGYLAPEAERESRQAVTCKQCQSYLKTFTTIGPLQPVELVSHDLTSLELDIAALEREYARPEGAGFPLQIELVPAERTSRWQIWRR
jgi:FdhE protein